MTAACILPMMAGSTSMAVVPDSTTQMAIIGNDTDINSDIGTNNELAELQKEFSFPDLNAQQTVLAEQLHTRLFNLYPHDFYQKFLNDAIGWIPETEDDLRQLEPEEQQFYHCMTNLNQVAGYKAYAKSFTYQYVAETPIQKVQNDLKALNYFFIDNMAQAAQQNKAPILDTNIKDKLKQQQLESIYDEFIHSADDELLRDMIVNEETNLPITLPMYAMMLPYYCINKYAPTAP